MTQLNFSELNKPVETKLPETSDHESISTRLEREEAIAALNKRRQGFSLSQREIAAIRKYEQHREDQTQERILSSIPQKTLTNLLSTTRKMLMEWESQGLPRNPDNTYNLYIIIPWLKSRWLSKNNPKNENYSPALERFRLAKAMKAELEYEILKGKYMRKDVADRDTIERILAMKDVMFRIPRLASPLLAPLTDQKQIEQLLKEFMREICNAFARCNDDELDKIEAKDKS
jgi:DNA-binding transcriptional regulator YiaG